MTLRPIIDKIKRHRSWRALSAIAIILLAGALIELLSLVQYNYAHSLVKEELDYRIENELTIKSIRVKGMLKSSEKMVKNYLWPVQRQIDDPDNIYNVIGRLVATNSDVMSSLLPLSPAISLTANITLSQLPSAAATASSPSSWPAKRMTTPNGNSTTRPLRATSQTGLTPIRIPKQVGRLSPPMLCRSPTIPAKSSGHLASTCQPRASLTP